MKTSFDVFIVYGKRGDESGEYMFDKNAEVATGFIDLVNTGFV